MPLSHSPLPSFCASVQGLQCDNHVLGFGLNVAGSCRHCWRPDCCCAQLCIVHFDPLTAAVLHRGILLCAVGFDSTYCMLWTGRSCLVCSSWDLFPGHSCHLHLPWHPGLAYVQPMQALCEGSRLASSQWQGGQSSRNDSLAPGPPHGWWEITSIHSCKASLEHNTTLNSPSLLQQQCRGVDSPICFNFCCPVPF